MARLKVNVTCEHESGEGLTQVEFECDDIYMDGDFSLVAEMNDRTLREFPESDWTAFAVERIGK